MEEEKGGKDTGELIPIKFIKAASSVRLIEDEDKSNESKKESIIGKVKAKLKKGL